MRYFYPILMLMNVIVCGAAVSNAAEQAYRGISDVSAAVFVEPNRFVVADDETNRLRIYEVGSAMPVSTLDLTEFLDVDSEHPEADIEAAAQADDTIYWITSHGRNKDGKERPSRRRFFGTKIHFSAAGTRLIPIGIPCTTLLHQFLNQSTPAAKTLGKAARFDEDLSKNERKKLAPKEEGLNIEGMACYQPHRSLLIGLRNPFFSPDGNTGDRALVFELLNPQAVIEGQPAVFGRTLFWDLGKRGIRGIEYNDRQRQYFIIAGPIDSETTFALYRWDGDFELQPELLTVWPDSDTFKPEGIARHPLDGRLWIFSDDGSLDIPVHSPAECEEGELNNDGTCPNKYLTDPARKTFRVRILPY